MNEECNYNEQEYVDMENWRKEATKALEESKKLRIEVMKRCINYIFSKIDNL